MTIEDAGFLEGDLPQGAFTRIESLVSLTLKNNGLRSFGYQILPPNMETLSMEEQSMVTFNIGALEVAVNPALSVNLVDLGSGVEYRADPGLVLGNGPRALSLVQTSPSSTSTWSFDFSLVSPNWRSWHSKVLA